MTAGRSSPNFVHRLNKRFAYTPVGSWLYTRSLHHLDRLWLRLTGGKRALSSVLAGLPVMTLTTTGAKSGLPRSIPIAGYADGDDYVLIASNFGQDHHPAWYHNLKAHPEATLTIDNVSRPYLAREAGDDERPRYWQLAMQTYAGYDTYKKWAGGRKIPVMVLSPKER